MKRNRLFVIIISVILLVSFVFLVPYGLEKIYAFNNNQTVLKILCYSYSITNNDDKILQYYPIMLYDENIQLVNKDDLLYELLESAVSNKNDNVFIENLTACYKEFSDYQTAVGNCSSIIEMRYETNKDLIFAKKCYKTLIDNSLNPQYRYYIFSKYNSFLFFTVGETNDVVEMREQGDVYWNEYEAWCEKENIKRPLEEY